MHYKHTLIPSGETNMPDNMKIENENLIITIPLKAERSNPYDDNYHEAMNNIVGIYERDYECGLAYNIDMTYANKADQHTDYFYKLHGDKKDFETMCKELKIDAIYEAQCAYCHQTIFGSFTLGEKGNMCYDCDITKGI